MTGLGTYLTGFSHGLCTSYPFRGISHPNISDTLLERELRALNIPGLNFRRVSVPNRDGKPVTGLYVEVNDYQDWRPTELSFHLMRLACKYEGQNPFVYSSGTSINGFMKHMGST